MSHLPNPNQGAIWLVDLDPAAGREQRGTRPVMVVSTDRFTHGPAEVVIVLPLTKFSRGIASHVPVARTESGLDRDSYIICEQVRCVSKQRFSRQIGRVPQPVIERVSLLLHVLLEL